MQYDNQSAFMLEKKIESNKKTFIKDKIIKVTF